jgi:hypothetical protein
MGSCGSCAVCHKKIRDNFIYDENNNTIEVLPNEMLICDDCSKKMNDTINKLIDVLPITNQTK